MSNTTTAVERYLPPKELSAAMCETYGICATPDRIRSIRRKVRAKGVRGLFIMGMARPSEFAAWVRDNEAILPQIREKV